jgi:SAM-dependent methyltransferase
MMVRLDFTGRAPVARALRIARRPAPGVAVVAECGPRLPFRDGSVDEIFAGRALSHRADVAESLEEIWRVCRPGALVHLRLPHASSVIASSQEPRLRPLLTLNTFNFYDPRFKPADAETPAAFTIERARLHLAGRRDNDSGLALARGPLAQFIEKLANGSRGSQYRFERWFAHLFGGFEEFSVVLAAVKPAGHRHPLHLARERLPLDETRAEPLRPDQPAGAGDPTSLRVTSDVAHEASRVDTNGDELAPDVPPAAGPTGSTLPHEPFVSRTLGANDE